MGKCVERLGLGLSVSALVFSTVVLVVVIVINNSLDEENSGNHTNGTNSDSVNVEQNSEYCQNVSSKQAMAHRKLYLSAEVTSGDVKLSLNAESQDNTWELTQNVDVTANGLIICQTGMYYVYNSVQFRTKEYVKKQTVYFYMRQTNKQHTSHVLLRNLHTVAENLSVDRETGFSGGVFHLDEGDVIEVFVSGQGLVETGRNTTYIGLVRLVH